MNKQKAIIGITLFTLCGIAFFIRVYFPYDQVFADGSVWFKGVDPWYHMRLVENLIAHFPHWSFFDPYTFYPHGAAIPWPPFYSWLIAGTALIAGLGHPSIHTIETVGAFTPAVLGTLVVIPVYFIGKELFNRWVGIIAATLLVAFPGEFLSRSLLGFTDHHVAEVLFSTVTILFVIMAVKRAREKEISFSHFINRDWVVVKKPLIYSLLAGIFLGFYLLTWSGAPMLLFIIFTYLGIQFIIDHLRSKSTDYLCIIGVLAFAIASIIAIPFLPKTEIGVVCHASLIIAIVTPLGLSGISRFMTSRRLKPAYYPLALLGAAGIGLLAFWIINPTLLRYILSSFQFFIPSLTGTTIQEARPLDITMALNNFSTAFPLAIITLTFLIGRTIKEKDTTTMLFLIWCVVITVATIVQRRYCYYLTVNVALLAGYICWEVLVFAGVKRLLTKPKEIVKAIRKSKKRQENKEGRNTRIKVVATGIIIFLLVFLPNIDGVKRRVNEGPVYIGGDWHNAFLWLKNNTPEPFDDPGYYYQLYEPPPAGEDYNYPDTAYGVISWWDYGHGITRVGRRIPVANPFQQAAPVAGRYFTMQKATEANQIMDELGAKYVMLDFDMTAGKFWAMVVWSGRDVNDFYGIYYIAEADGRLQPVQLFYPSYYNTTVARLYNFNGQAVIPAENATIVISYKEQISQQGAAYRLLASSQAFVTYEEASDFLADHTGNYQIVGTDLFNSPIPLEKLEHYELIYKSPSQYPVKIFEYTGGQDA